MYALGNDHTAVALKQIIKAHLEAKGIEVKDFGTDSTTASNYAEKAEEVANAVASGECERGIYPSRQTKSTESERHVVRNHFPPSFPNSTTIPIFSVSERASLVRNLPR